MKGGNLLKPLQNPPPFVKGGSRGILLRPRLPENHLRILTLQAKLNYTTSTAGGF